MTPIIARMMMKEKQMVRCERSDHPYRILYVTDIGEDAEQVAHIEPWFARDIEVFGASIVNTKRLLPWDHSDNGMSVERYRELYRKHNPHITHP